MLLSELINKCGFDVVTANDLNKEIKDGYVGDLLSDVMGNAPAESIWLTVQSHVNILAVATITGVKAILLCNGLSYEEETIEKAKENGITLLATEKSSFKACMSLFEAGLR
ncbi:MAG: iron-sulfur binding hydrogenase [Thermotogae bacterium]|uniref:iron-sulfur binding hydrogenase n=1 Tax=Kosmotoga sp. TaxID=1955248 RepID=UPI000F13A0CE|nr:iron-sulfur binding hydrogenase [Kosmotoga sp.]MBO8166205.1 iron-sulfur binding hydrogenase [Kosmotoga sp.]MCD6159499.1 iron-sulfur binding hydrogenase [Kosmotoga sp.]RKX50581.1 MAG: iron-sulfur binding hydrogenase [Thermotogota bacterium]